jgi:hypothetical protein
MRNGADRKDPLDNEFYQNGLTTAHQFMSVTPDLPQFDISPTGKPQLFCIDTDPREDSDVAVDHPCRLNSMVRAWDAWFAEVTEDWPSTLDANTQPQESAEHNSSPAKTGSPLGGCL